MNALEKQPAKFVWRNAAIVINARAGSAGGVAPDQLGVRIRDLLGVEVSTFLASDGSELEQRLNEALESSPSALIIYGGDGTLRTGAKAALKADLPIVPLPGGTMNVLPKLVFGHGDLDATLSALPQMSPISRDIGVIGGEPFFLSAACGYAGPMTRLREAMRPPRNLSAVWSALEVCARALGPSLRGGVGWRLPDEDWRRSQTLVLAVGNVERVVQPSEYQDKLHSSLHVLSVNANTAWEMAKVAGQAILSDWRSADGVEMGRAAVVELNLGKRPLVVLDGEPVRLGRLAPDAQFKSAALQVMSVSSQWTAGSPDQAELSGTAGAA